jgi:atypical dual specificity phosphatase
MMVYIPWGLFNQRFRNQPWWTHVDKHVLLGAVPLRRYLPTLFEKENVTAIVNLCEEFCGQRHFRKRDVDMLRVPTVDLTCPSLEDVHKGVWFIKEHTDRGENVYGTIVRIPLEFLGWSDAV